MPVKMKDISALNWFHETKPSFAFLVSNFWQGVCQSKKFLEIPDPMAGGVLSSVPDTQPDEINDLLAEMEKCPIYGLHNPLHNPGRYAHLGEVCFKAAAALSEKENADYFARLISISVPKDYKQAMGEVEITARFLKTFCGNNVRFLGKGETIPGDEEGYEGIHYPWPFGPVAIIAPFNFPLEIPALQLMGALFMGNKPVLKPDPRVAIVADAFLRLLWGCGLPTTDVCLLNGGGEVAEKLVTAKKANGDYLIQMVQFTGSTGVARRLAVVTEGRVRFEDSGLGWKILGPNFLDEDISQVVEQCDKDAYSASAQKCSAQKFLFPHRKWLKKDLYLALIELEADRKLGDLTIGATVTWSNQRLYEHSQKVLKIERAKLLWGNASFVPPAGCEGYGYMMPTAIEVPLDKIRQYFDIVTTEVFAPFQLVIPWETDEELEQIISFLNDLPRHLTAAVVDRDKSFCQKILSRTKPGVTYAGIKAPTTGTPEWLHFGPTSHPADCGIGTPEAIIRTWSQPRLICRREDG